MCVFYALCTECTYHKVICHENVRAAWIVKLVHKEEITLRISEKHSNFTGKLKSKSDSGTRFSMKQPKPAAGA